MKKTSTKKSKATTKAKSATKSKTVAKAKAPAKAKAKVAAKPKAASKPKPAMKAKTKEKPNLLVELIERKKEMQKMGGSSEPFDKFKRKKGRNENNSNIGPSWGPRKGN